MDADTEDGWRYLLQTERGQNRAKLQEIHRKLTIALDALKADPPFTVAAIERIEDCIALITKGK